MLKKLMLGLALVGFTATLLAADAFTGTWKLNVAKSKLTPGTEVKEITVVVAEEGANLAVAVKGTAGDGTPISVKYTLPAKGGPVSYTEGAPPTGATATTKRVNATHDRQHELAEWKRSRQHPHRRQRRWQDADARREGHGPAGQAVPEHRGVRATVSRCRLRPGSHRGRRSQGNATSQEGTASSHYCV